jgi:hypothetical protein
MLKKLLIAVLLALASVPAIAASLLPNGEQVFLDNNGSPLAGGSVYFYVPGTLTPKDTWVNSGQTVLNTNPVVLDSAGRAIIYGSGSYRQILKDSLGNTIWDQLTSDPAGAAAISWGGTSTGSANAQVVSTSGFSGADGQQICWIAGFSNTSSMTLQPSNSSAIPVRRDTPGGPLLLAGGEVVLGNVACAIYDLSLGAFHLVDNPQYFFGTLTAIASSTTTDLGTIPSHNVSITGTTAITSFGSSANSAYPLYFITFTGALTLTHNATSLILPGGANITTAAGDTAVARYLGSGNWRVISYTAAAVSPGSGLKNIQVFTSGSGTYTPTAGATRAIVFVTGGGGGGGGAATNNGQGGGGGGGGATAITFVPALSSVSYAVGAAGTAGANTGTNGGAGGQSSFGTITANGGSGGTGGTASAFHAGGAGSSTTAGGTFSVAGVAGSGSSNAAGFLTAGSGGGSYWGQGSIAIGNAAAGFVGTDAAAPGAGGSGGFRNGGTDVVGGAGGLGIVVVLEF